jgi:hypothetical protein
MYRIESVEVIHPQNNFMDDRWNKRSSSPRHFIILAEIDRSAGSPHSKHTFQSLHFNHPSCHRLLLCFHGDEPSVHLSLDKSHLDTDSEVVEVRRTAKLHAMLLAPRTASQCPLHRHLGRAVAQFEDSVLCR